MRARLILIEPVDPGTEPTVYDVVAEQPTTLGRSRDNTIVLRDEHASRMHARIHCEDGVWWLSDFGLNGTRVNGQRVNQLIELEHGHEIRIGDTRLKFSLGDGLTMPAPESRPLVRQRKMPAPGETMAETATRLQPDELTVLCRFMATAVEEQEPQSLLRQALGLILVQTGADMAGYLSDDPTDPLPKFVLPEHASVDAHLSRQLTRRVHRDGKTVWLGADLSDSRPSDSLMTFNDAICLPLKAAGRPLGALHVYKNEAFFSERDVRFCEVLAGYLSNSLQTLRIRRSLEAENSRLRSRLPSTDDIVGDSSAMQQLRLQIARAAPQPSTVLIHGESGTGKELVALALHKQSPRANNPLVVVNCAAIAPSLLEAELFGYRKGAFSGADQDYPGLFQQADDGTLFLDEIGELSLDCQAKLLRVIEGKGFRPVGATNECKTDVRIIAATHRDLEQEVKAGRFRSDLLFRMKVITIAVPPLREHPEDVPYLVQYFLDRLSVECRRTVRLTDAALAKLKAYVWPGNVRQLRAVLESAVVMSEKDEVDADALPLSAVTDSAHPPTLNLDDLETWAINQALRQTNGNITQAAKLLGVVRDTLTAKMRRKGIDRVDS